MHRRDPPHAWRGQPETRPALRVGAQLQVVVRSPRPSRLDECTGERLALVQQLKAAQVLARRRVSIGIGDEFETQAHSPVGDVSLPAAHADQGLRMARIGFARSSPVRAPLPAQREDLVQALVAQVSLELRRRHLGECAIAAVGDDVAAIGRQSRDAGGIGPIEPDNRLLSCRTRRGEQFDASRIAGKRPSLEPVADAEPDGEQPAAFECKCRRLDPELVGLRGADA